jgi:hypothetical protein
VLHGDKAVKALDKYIQKLEKQKAEDLTEKQAYALIKTAKVLRTAIAQSKPTEKSREELGLLERTRLSNLSGFKAR